MKHRPIEDNIAYRMSFTNTPPIAKHAILYTDGGIVGNLLWDIGEKIRSYKTE